MIAQQESKRGLFIVLEGIDGSGTTTQVARLLAWFREKGWPVHATREPSGGPVGALLRQILSGRVIAPVVGTGGAEPVDPRTVALLFAADRLDHVRCEVEPQLARGVHVLSDRYVVSSLAYQSIEAPRSWVEAINAQAPPADLTVLLRVSPEVALERIASTRADRERFENLGMLARVAAEYERQMAQLPPERRLVVDGEAPPDAVEAQIRERIEALQAAPASPTAS